MGELGRLLRQLRQEHAWTLRDVEAKTGIPNAHLSQVETGNIERPSEGLLYDLANLYEVSFDDLSRLAGHAVPTEGVDRREFIDVALRALDETVDPQDQRDFLLELEQRARRARRARADDDV